MMKRVSRQDVDARRVQDRQSPDARSVAPGEMPGDDDARVVPDRGEAVAAERDDEWSS